MAGLFRDDSERRQAQLIAALATANPFLEERIKLERALLGSHFVEGVGLWRYRSALAGAPSPNADRVDVIGWSLADRLCDRLENACTATVDELNLYGDVARYALYIRHEVALTELTMASQTAQSKLHADGYEQFRRDALRLLVRTGRVDETQLPHLYATVFQVRRAFHHIFTNVVGSSTPAARLRGDIWTSIFTHDLRRHFRSLWALMQDTPTLILGDSGTGKELVARAIAESGYLTFDPATRTFPGPFEGRFLPLNVAALAPTLVESELFGHRRGAFTGAATDHTGYLERTAENGAVFLDEIGDLDPAIQVKLLRVLQTRSFRRLGDPEPRAFAGKILAATHQDLDERMERGQFREDLYYRLCADVVVTPTLADRLADDPDELDDLVLFLTIRIAGVEEGPALADEVVRFVTDKIGFDYAWPGNVRELEQCVRNVMIRRCYEPRRARSADLAETIARGEMTLDEMTGAYVRLVYERVGSFKGTAERLGMDRRTVARWVRTSEAGPSR